MATPSSDAKPKKVFRISRFAIGVNVLLQILTVVFILGVINYFAFNHYRRWDFSRNQKHVLSGADQEHPGRTCQAAQDLRLPLAGSQRARRRMSFRT